MWIRSLCLTIFLVPFAHARYETEAIRITETATCIGKDIRVSKLQPCTDTGIQEAVETKVKQSVHKRMKAECLQHVTMMKRAYRSRGTRVRLDVFRLMGMETSSVQKLPKGFSFSVFGTATCTVKLY